MKSNVTQDEVAAKMGVVRSVIGKVERGERRLDVIELRNYCSAIGVPLGHFIEDLERALDLSNRQGPS